ncbi:AAA family ATPase [Desulfobacterales bacterium HSG2]|nr:AAA family ATPase [Desulfobacterales bacterium HSG2]
MRDRVVNKMITDLEITGFRGFDKFRLHDLGRVNLLVGINNGGKTSILEAIEFLASQGDLRPISAAIMRRGEYMWSDSQREVSDLEIDACRLFHGYNMDADTCFTIRGKCKNTTNTVQAAIIENGSDNSSEQIEFPGPYLLKLIWNLSDVREVKLRLSHQGGLSYSRLGRRYNRNPSEQTSKAFFISTDSLSMDEVVPLFEDIVLTPEEQLVIESIKIIEPTIERIASVSGKKGVFIKSLGIRGGLVVKCKGIRQRIPIGSMGDGIWRMLGIALALVKAKDGILLIDEIDTDLHFTVMEDLWKLITQAANRLNVQVFATTHNSDCWRSLADVLCDDNAVNDGVTIQRIEKDKKESVAFTEEEIVIAAERETEVR